MSHLYFVKNVSIFGENRFPFSRISPPFSDSTHNWSNATRKPFSSAPLSLRIIANLPIFHSLPKQPTMALPPHSNSVATITHVIFDMDGLLLDTEGFYTEVQERILERYGKSFDWSLKAKMMGRKAIEAARVFVEETGIADRLSPEAFLLEREDMLREMFPASRLMPGAERLIRHLHSNGVPISIATGSHQRHFDLKTQNHKELFGLMHHIVKGDDPEVVKGKPSPDIYLLAAKRFEDNVDYSSVLVFEDAPSGVAAAKNAGMWVVMVPDPRLDISYHQGADQVLNSLLDFQPSCWGLPPFLSDDQKSA